MCKCEHQCVNGREQHTSEIGVLFCQSQEVTAKLAYRQIHYKSKLVVPFCNHG